MRSTHRRFIVALAAASTATFLASFANAAALTWGNGGIGGDGTTWDTTQLNWNAGTAAFNNGDDVTFSDSNNGNYAVSIPASISANSITATNINSNYTLSIAAGQTLASGATAIGQTATANATNVIMTGGGSFSETSGNLTVSEQNALSTAPIGLLDASGLSSFSYNVPTGQIQIGVGARTAGTLKLANTGSSVNTLIASVIRIGDSVPQSGSGSTGNNGGTSTVSLGAGQNIINTANLTIGNGKASGVVNLLATGGTVTIAGTTGGSSTANITIGRQSSATGTSTASQLLLAGATATVQANIVIVGDLNGATSATATGIVTFDTGTFSATSLQIAADLSGADANGTKGTFTLGTNASSTGTLNAAALVIGNVTSTATTNRADSATFIINGGTASVTSDIVSTNALPANVTLTSNLSLLGGTLNMNGNQIGHASGNNKNITTITMPAAGKSATLLNLGGTGINDAGLTVNGGGTLVLGGTNSYTNNTTIANNSTLLLDGSYTGAGTINANAGTLGGKGSTTGAVSIAAGATLAPGDNSIYTLGVGSAAIAGNLSVDLNDSDPNIVDLLNDAGALDISAATSNVTFNITGTPSQAAYIFAKYGSLVGTNFGTVSNLPAGYSINYNYLGQNEVALVAGAAVPEPASLALLALAAPALLRRRR